MILHRTLHFSLLVVILTIGNITYAALPLSTDEGIPTLAPILEKVLPAVVNIEIRATVKARNQIPLPFQDFFNLPQQRRKEKQRSGAGSGVIINADKGYIVTNSHVVAKADDIFITLNDGRQFKASLLGTDPDTDIALLTISADNLLAIEIGNSEQLKVGDFVIAIGNPFGLNQSVTSGIVSALGRSNLGIESYEDFIQTDASINPGNSGGALINLKGELIGINTAILGPSGGNIGIGFAIPVKMVTTVIAHLLEFGEVKRGLLGVSIQTLTPELASAFGTEHTQGAIITEIQADSAAEKAGLKPGDVVLSINNQKVTNASDMRNFIGLLRTGTTIKLKVLRDDNELDFSAVISDREKSYMNGKKLSLKLQGSLLQKVKEKDTPYKLNGILVKAVKPGSVAYNYGLREGDLIVSANRKRVQTLDDLATAISSTRAILLDIRRGTRSLFIALR